MPHPQPGQLDHDVAQAPVAGLGDALLAINRPASPWGRHQPRISGHLTSVGKAPVETFKIKHRGNLRADRLEPRCFILKVSTGALPTDVRWPLMRGWCRPHGEAGRLIASKASPRPATGACATS